jgi:hypothetical protein
VRAARQYLLALLEHLGAWSYPVPAGGCTDARVAGLQHDLLGASRSLVLAVARNEPTAPSLAGRLASLTNLYRVRSCPGAPVPRRRPGPGSNERYVVFGVGRAGPAGVPACRLIGQGE